MRKTSRRAIYHHMSPTKNLRRILKEGLLPVYQGGVKPNYTGEDSMGSVSVKTFGGIYLSRDLDVVYDYYDSDNIIVSTTLESRSPKVLFDEDLFMDLLVSYPYKMSCIQDLFRGKVFPVDGEPQSPKDIDRLYKAIWRSSLKVVVQDKLNRLKNDLPNLDSDLARFGREITASLSVAIRHIATHLLAGFVKTRFPQSYDSRFQNNWKKMRLAIDRVSHYLNKEDGVGKGSALRFFKPITYKGRNRIVSIIRITEDRKNRMIMFTLIYNRDNSIWREWLDYFRDLYGEAWAFEVKAA